MSAGWVLNSVLAVLVLGVAGAIIAVRTLFAAVVGFVVLGLLLAIVWVRLAAVDVALTEAAIGSGVTGAVLIAAASRLRATEKVSVAEQPGPALRVGAGILSALVAAGLAALVVFAADPAPSLAPAAVAHLVELGVGNPVTAVLLAYRGIDTLLEKMVLLLALLGVWSLAPDMVWGGAPEVSAGAVDGGALALLGRVLPPVGIVVGVYVLWVGATDPGGAFQGGAVIASMWILALMAGLLPAPAIRARWVRRALVAGPAVFLAVGMAGFAWPGGFLSYPAGYAKPLIVAIEAALTFSVVIVLGLLAAGPPHHGPGR